MCTLTLCVNRGGWLRGSGAGVKLTRRASSLKVCAWLGPWLSAPRGGRSFTDIHGDVETMSQCGAGAGPGRAAGTLEDVQRLESLAAIPGQETGGLSVTLPVQGQAHIRPKCAHAEGESVSGCQKGMPDQRVLIWAGPGIRSACSLGPADLSHTRPSALTGLAFQNPSHLFPQGCLACAFPGTCLFKNVLCVSV